MPYNIAAVSFQTKKLCSRLSSSKVRFFTQIGRFAFLRPPLGDLGATYDNHRKAHWKARSGLSISINWTFFARCYGWGATSENRSNIGDFAPTRSLWSKISRYKGSPPPIIFSQLVKPMNALQLCRWQFSHKKKLCSRLSSSEERFSMEIGRFAFLRPPFRDLGQRTTIILGSLESA